MIDKSKISNILIKNEMLRTYINSLENSVNKCSNDSLSEMRLTKGHLDFIHYSQKLIDKNDYNIINDFLGDIGLSFKKCKCKY